MAPQRRCAAASLVLGLVAIALLPLAALAATGDPPTAPLQTSYVLTATPAGRSAQTLGINSGHNYDPSWLAWTSRLGVKSALLGARGLHSSSCAYIEYFFAS